MCSYAHTSAANALNFTANTKSHNQNLEDKLPIFLNDFKNMFSQLINRNNMMLGMLTVVINNIPK